MNNIIWSIFQNKSVRYFAIITFLLYISSLTITQIISRPQVTSTIPSANQSSVSIYSKLSATFNKQVEIESLIINSEPKHKWTVKQNSNKNFDFYPEIPMQPNTKYTLNILLENNLVHSLNFMTEESQTDSKLLKEMYDELANDYPLGQLTPYKNSQYSLVYSAPKTIEITILNPNLTQQEILSEVRSWVTQNGGDVSAHEFTFSSP